MTTYPNNGDASFSEDYRNPGNLVGSHPMEADSVPEKYLAIAEQRHRILESFLAEHAGLLPSQITQITTVFPNGDVQWHLEVRQ